MDETKYIMSSPEMVKILREGDEMIAKGNFESVMIVILVISQNQFFKWTQVWKKTCN